MTRMRFEPGKEYVLEAEAPIGSLGVEAGELVYVNVTQNPPVVVVKEHGLAAAAELRKHLARGSLSILSATPLPIRRVRRHLTLLP